MKPIVYTFASIPTHPGAVRMTKSCKAWGWNVRMTSGPWGGDVKCQVHGFAKELDGFRKAGYTHALRLDAFDVVAVGPPSELEAVLEHYGNPVLLMGAECAAWPADYRIKDYPERKHPWWFAHSPCLVDLTQELPESYLKIAHDGYGEDQRHFADLILDGMPGVAIDRDCLWLQSLGHCNPWPSFFRVEGDRIVNTVLNSKPLFAHGNGGQLADMEWLPVKS